MASAKSAASKASKGSVGIESVNGRLRLNLPRQWFDGKQKRPSLGLPDTKPNRKKAEAIARQMEMDALGGNLDLTLAKYGIDKPIVAIVPDVEKETEISLLELWDKFCDYMKPPRLAETTYLRTYRGLYLRMFTKAVETVGNKPLDIRHWITSNYSQDNARYGLGALDNCYQFGIKHGLIKVNPYLGMGSELTQKKRAKSEEAIANSSIDGDEFSDIKAFLPEEKKAIIKAYETSARVCHWANYIKFLFMTGCRPGEAAALKWKHIKDDFSIILFAQNYSAKHRITKSTKTETIRIFPCNAELQAFLKSIKPSNATSEDLVLKSATGKQIDHHSFFRTWSGNSTAGHQSIIARLIEEGSVKQYLKPYATRHTFITEQVNAGVPAHVIGAWVGNSADVIWKHYCDNRNDWKPV